jgi:nicotinamide riboside kinase
LKSKKTIVVTGPECAGKTMLSQALASHLKSALIQEYSVEYLDQLSGNYDIQDLVNISREQKRRIKFAEKENQIVIADTACLVLKVWAEVRFKKVPPEIEEWWTEENDYIYLLCTPDLPWEPGPYRENPDDRDELFEMYRRHLWEADRKFAVINGRNRLPQALDFLELHSGA